MATKLTVEQIDFARAQRAAGTGWEKLGRLMHCDPETVRRALDPDYRRKRMDQINAARYGRAHSEISAARFVAPPADVLRRREHRVMLRPTSLTALLCGDPLPGESALDRRSTDLSVGNSESLDQYAQAV
jgi:hypothetical protein